MVVKIEVTIVVKTVAKHLVAKLELRIAKIEVVKMVAAVNFVVVSGLYFAISALVAWKVARIVTKVNLINLG